MCRKSTFDRSIFDRLTQLGFDWTNKSESLGSPKNHLSNLPKLFNCIKFAIFTYKLKHITVAWKLLRFSNASNIFLLHKTICLLPNKHCSDCEPEDAVGVGDAEPPPILVAVLAQHRLLQLLAGIAVIWKHFGVRLG